jgi:hypothetical protein
MKSVYICHSMTNSGQNLELIDKLITWLKLKKHRIIRPKYNLFPDMVASDTLDTIELADLIIGDVTVYSHGVGFELGFAYAMNKKIIVIAHESAKEKVSRFIVGLFPRIIFYSDENQLIEAITEQLQNEYGVHEEMLMAV